MTGPEGQREPITELLTRWRRGDSEARDRIAEELYPELRRIAASHMRGERRDHTLQPTALVHEAYARLVDLELSWQDRTHFLSMASRLMRRVLVDHARASGARKRGRDQVRITLDDDLALVQPCHDILDLDVALEELGARDHRAARAVELHYFGGLGYVEIATALGVSEATVERDLRFARAWLSRRLDG